MLRDWLIIAIAVVALWALWGILNITFNCIDYWHAARKGEDSQAARERGD